MADCFSPARKEMEDRDEQAWKDLIQEHGTAFQTLELCRIFERTWPGRYQAQHIVLAREHTPRAVIPAYLYETCPRVDYYKRACPEQLIDDPLLLSHALVGWYGFPVATDRESKRLALREFVRAAQNAHAIAMFAGIDARDVSSIQALRDERFVLQRFHTLMVRDIAFAPPDDPTAAHPPRRRSHLRKMIYRAERAGCRVRLAQAGDRDSIVSLIASMMQEKGLHADVLPADFLAALLEEQPPGLDVLVAVNPEDRPIGVHINLRWRFTYAMWLGGNDRASLDRYYQSHLLYEYNARRARQLGYTELQAGRSPYQIKFQHGFTPVPLLCAVRGTTPAQHQRAARWVKALARRHRAMYPSVCGDDYGEQYID